MLVFNRDALRVKLDGLTRQNLLFFSGLCAERLSGTFWAFSKREGRSQELDGYAAALSWVWRNISVSAVAPEAGLHLRKLTSIIHDSERFGDPLAVQAQSAGIALMYVLKIFISGGSDEATWAAMTVTEGIENYVAFSADMFKFRLTPDFQNSLLERELQKQEEDIRLLQSSYAIDVPSIRTRNRLFAVPIAV